MPSGSAPLIAMLLVLCAGATRVLAAPPVPGAPTRPMLWMYVSTADGSGALLQDEPWGSSLAVWPDGAVMGVDEGPVQNGEATWFRVQDPGLVEGWMVADRLTTPSVPLEKPDFSSRFISDYGGILPLAATKDCPTGFPVRAVITGRGMNVLIAWGPGDPEYVRVSPSVCFRSREEAVAWGYDYRGPAEP